MNALLSRIRSIPTATILEACSALRDAEFGSDRALVLAKLLEEYENREGPEAADRLMDRLGM